MELLIIVNNNRTSMESVGKNRQPSPWQRAESRYMDAVDGIIAMIKQYEKAAR